MKIGNVSFSKTGWEEFTQMTRYQQRKKLGKANPQLLDKEIDSLLKNVKYGKSSSTPKSSKKSKQSNKTANLDSGNNTEKQGNGASEKR